jgi:hypothetical protein
VLLGASFVILSDLFFFCMNHTPFSRQQEKQLYLEN